LTACVVEKDDKLSFSITNFERCFSCQGDVEADVSGWFKALDESISLASERKTIEKKSLAIHNLVLNKLLRQYSKEETRNVASLPHSPFVWNHPSFYQSYGLQQSSTLKKAPTENRKSLKNFKRLTFDVKKEDEDTGPEEEEPQTPDLSQSTASKLLKINAKRIETPLFTNEKEDEDEGSVKIVMSEDTMNETKGKKSIHLTKKYATDHVTVSVEGDDGNKFENILDGIVKSDKIHTKIISEEKPIQSPRSKPMDRVKSATNIRQKSQFLIGDDLNALLSMNPTIPSSKAPSINQDEKEVKEKRKKKKQNSVFLQLHNNLRETMTANFDIQIDD
jgi:hypothetical protein